MVVYVCRGWMITFLELVHNGSLTLLFFDCTILLLYISFTLLFFYYPLTLLFFDYYFLYNSILIWLCYPFALLFFDSTVFLLYYPFTLRFFDSTFLLLYNSCTLRWRLHIGRFSTKLPLFILNRCRYYQRISLKIQLVDIFRRFDLFWLFDLIWFDLLESYID